MKSHARRRAGRQQDRRQDKTSDLSSREDSAGGSSAAVASGTSRDVADLTRHWDNVLASEGLGPVAPLATPSKMERDRLAKWARRGEGRGVPLTSNRQAERDFAERFRDNETYLDGCRYASRMPLSFFGEHGNKARLACEMIGKGGDVRRVAAAVHWSNTRVIEVTRAMAAKALEGGRIVPVDTSEGTARVTEEQADAVDALWLQTRGRRDE